MVKHNRPIGSSMAGIQEVVVEQTKGPNQGEPDGNRTFDRVEKWEGLTRTTSIFSFTGGQWVMITQYPTPTAGIRSAASTRRSFQTRGQVDGHQPGDGQALLELRNDRLLRRKRRAARGARGLRSVHRRTGCGGRTDRRLAVARCAGWIICWIGHRSGSTNSRRGSSPCTRTSCATSSTERCSASGRRTSLERPAWTCSWSTWNRRSGPRFATARRRTERAASRRGAGMQTHRRARIRTL